MSPTCDCATWQEKDNSLRKYKKAELALQVGCAALQSRRSFAVKRCLRFICYRTAA